MANVVMVSSAFALSLENIIVPVTMSDVFALMLESEKQLNDKPPSVNVTDVFVLSLDKVLVDAHTSSVFALSLEAVKELTIPLATGAHQQQIIY